MKNFSTQEDKDLLLQDLCSRLYHGVICSIYRIDDWGVGWRNEELTGYWRDGNTFEFYFGETPISIYNDISKIKPYLRPMSSMTDEEKEEYRNIDNRSYSCPIDYAHVPASDRIDWLNAHQFDYRGLIEKGLAIEAPEGMYKKKRNNYRNPFKWADNWANNIYAERKKNAEEAEKRKEEREKKNYND